MAGLVRRGPGAQLQVDSGAQTAANCDIRTVDGFGREWSRFDQRKLASTEALALWRQYFSLVDSDALGPETRALDVGCGSGRWAVHLAPLVGSLAVVDASAEALEVARRNLAGQSNCSFHLASVDALPVDDGSMDLVYSLGVLHHVPDTASGIRACAQKLKAGGQLLIYLYYRFDGRPMWFRAAWRISDTARRGVSALPFTGRRLAADVLASTVYWPLARFSGRLEKRGHSVSGIPLSFYRDKSFYTMRTDALDRFGTRLEQRFTRSEIRRMFEKAGLVDIRFREDEPFWCVIGTRATTR